MTTFESVLKWYSGKSLEGAKAALAMLTEAVTAGYWPAGYSRKVTAALNKQNVAKKYAKGNPTYNGPDGSSDYDSPNYPGLFGMYFGYLAPRASKKGPATDPTVLAWAADFAPVAAAVEKLNATKMKPTLRFMKTLSAMVLANVGAEMGLDLTTVEAAPMEWYEVTEVDEKGKVTYRWKVRMVWPEGTVHNASKHAAKDSNCHACGHKISNPFNWVPLMATGPDGKKVSLWVGRDCARNLFGCEVSNHETALRSAE